MTKRRAALCLAALLAFQAGTLAGEARSLFLPGPTAEIARSRVPQTAKRSRQVRIDHSLFTGPGAALSAATAAGRPAVRMRLFDDADYTVVFDRIRTVGPGGRVWIGHLEGAGGTEVPGSFVSLSARGGAVVASVLVPGTGSFGIRYAGKGVHVVWEHDPAKASKKLPPRKHPVAAAAAETATPRRALAKTGDTVVDIMVVYTDAAETAAGSQAAVEADIIIAVGVLNDTFFNSDVDVEANLVHMEKVTYTETGDLFADLDNLTYVGAPYADLDGVHAVRAAYGADLVCLFVENGGGSAGLAWELLPGDTPATMDPWAFSVVERLSAAGPIFAFPHETGHNMGCGHEDSAAYYPDSKAHDFGNPLVPPNTMMISVGEAIPYFSNPGVIYPGNGQPSGVLNVSDNARALQHTAPNIVAPIRASVWPEVTITDPTEGATVQLSFVTAITATASDPDGTVTSVAFYDDGALIATDSDGAPWTVDWTPATSGGHVLTAVAKDDAGLFTPTAAQPVVNVTVVPDDDGDGLPNWWEQLYSTGATVLNYQDFDSDSDGTWDGDDDDDGDTLTNAEEYLLGTNPVEPDSEFDGMPDDWEVANGLDPLADDAALDAEGDGMSNLDEYLMGTDPNVTDSDGDSLPDGWEFLYYDVGTPEWLDPAQADSDSDTFDDDTEDHDGDLLTNAEEFAEGTNPILADTDGDTLDDWEELNASSPFYPSDPTKPDSDGDGLDDLEERTYGTDPMLSDTDNDGMPDAWEVAYLPDLDPLTKDAGADPDGDGFANSIEYAFRTDPGDPLSHPPIADDDGCSPGGAARFPGLLLWLAAVTLALRRRRRFPGAAARARTLN